MDPGEAFRTWMRSCDLAGWKAAVGSETVGVVAACGRVTAEPVRARWPVPAYRAAAMDGIAVSTADTGTQAGTIRLSPEGFDPVDTGDPVPDDCDAVVKREEVTLTPDGGAEIIGPVVAGRHIRRVGEEIQLGAVVLPAGHRIRPADAAAVAAAGHESIVVRRRPRVAILPTGSEIRPVGATLAPGEILDTNSIMLAGLAEEAGCDVDPLPIAPDAPDLIGAAVVAAARTADVVLIIAGSSAGRDDYTSAVIRQLGRVAVHGVAMRPGHPVVLGVLGGSEQGDQTASGHPLGCSRPGSPAVPVVGIPGYPVAAERAFTCFVRPLLRHVLETGAARTLAPGVTARLAEPITSAEHLDEYLSVRLAAVMDPGTGTVALVALVLPRGAGALNTLVQTEAILRVPAGIAGYRAGATVQPVPVGGAAFATRTTVVRGLCSPATDALVEVLGADLPLSAVHWRACTEEAAVDALAAGLCHAAAISVDAPGVRPCSQSVATLVERLGPVILFELSRRGDQAEVLVVPAAASDSRVVEELRAALRSMDYRRARCDPADHSARRAGHETWHGPEEHPVREISTARAGSAKGATRSAAR